MSDRTVRTLGDLLATAAMAERVVARGRATYDGDEALRLAAEAIVHTIGEVVARLPDEVLDAHPEIPWRAMKAARNVIAHRYEQVGYAILWSALAERVPQLAKQIRTIVDGESSPEGVPGPTGP